MKIPLLDLQRQNQPIESELREAFERVLHSGHFILGREVEEFEVEAARIAGTRYAIGMSSGTDAILCALMALGIGPGDEVICPAFTFFATGGCIARLGATPVFADSCAECFNIDPAKIEPLITARTRAMIPVHLYGQAADLDPILEIARRHHLAVIEDAAQAFGAEYRGRPVGFYGEFATVSFFPTKNLGALGDAGLLLANDPMLAERARLLRVHGARERYFHETVGGNFRLDALQAALLRVKLPRLNEYTAGRQRNACAYTRAFAGLKNSAVEILPPILHPDRTHIMNQYTLCVRGGRRDALKKFLAERDIASEIYYPLPLHRQECFRRVGPHARLPVAERLAEEALSIPVFPEMTEAELDAVIGAVTEFAQRG
ncbi:MAG TPA: DegT/DnrJ/EryC1/StrS family aminotransferase [Bryobacteraceae bacterium]|jgi:dTDP-4-amino-4,6-dideoxygalactose transaminase